MTAAGAEYGCGCSLLPVLWFRVDGTWDRADTLRDRLPLVGITWAERQAFRAVELYQLCDASTWVIACPRCRAIYLGATAPVLPPPDDLDDYLDLDDDDAVAWPVPRAEPYLDDMGADFLT